MRPVSRQFVIRRAKRCDAGAVARMAAALAKHEGKKKGPFTAERFRREGFGRGEAFRTLVAEIGGEAVGYALFYPGYDVDSASRGIHMADLFVAASARRRGIGRTLVAAVAEECRRVGGSWVAWFVRRDNCEALAFYRALGAERDDDIPFEMHLAGRQRLKENRPCRRR